MKLIFPLVMIVAVAFTLGACESSVGTEPSKGTMYGHVLVRDQFTNEPDDRSGFEITVWDETRSFTATTNREGVWDVGGVPAGVYGVTITIPAAYDNEWVRVRSAHSNI